MDVDFWGSTVHSSKHFSAPPSSGNHVLLNNSEANEDTRTYFTCPFCYVDIELSMLCDHLQDEHCFNVTNAVCPVCALNLGKDVIAHFEVHHVNSIKTQRMSQKSGYRNFYMGRSSLCGLSTKRGREDEHGSAPDPLLSPFLFSISHTVAKDDQSNNLCSINDISTIHEAESSKQSTLSQSEETEGSEESSQRAAFCQQLILSTIF